MTISAEASKYMNMRDNLTISERAVIDSCFCELYAGCRSYGIKAAKDDRAAELEAAIIKFLIDSKEG